MAKIVIKDNKEFIRTLKLMAGFYQKSTLKAGVLTITVVSPTEVKLNVANDSLCAEASFLAQVVDATHPEYTFLPDTLFQTKWPGGDLHLSWDSPTAPLEIKDTWLKTKLKVSTSKSDFPSLGAPDQHFALPHAFLKTLVTYLDMPYVYLKNKPDIVSVWLRTDADLRLHVFADDGGFAMAKMETEIVAPFAIDEVLPFYALQDLYSNAHAETQCTFGTKDYSLFLTAESKTLRVQSMSDAHFDLDEIFGGLKTWEASCNFSPMILHTQIQTICNFVPSKDLPGSTVKVAFDASDMAKLDLSLVHRDIGEIDAKLSGVSDFWTYNGVSRYVFDLHPPALLGFSSLVKESKQMCKMMVNHEAVYFHTDVPTTFGKVSIRYLFPTVGSNNN